ncbi:MAG: hypothetical protein RSD41_02155 [Kiritimatiellia bacterium]
MMLILGLISGLLSALLQSFSYVCSALFLQKHRSIIGMLLYSQALMGACCLPLVLWFFPYDRICLWQLLAWLVPLWLLCYAGGQYFFFWGQMLLESSKLVSLLGLKIPFLALFMLIFQHHGLNGWRWFAVALTMIGATLFNWTGGRRITLKAIIVVLATVVFYCGCDLLETRLVGGFSEGAQAVGPILSASLLSLGLLYTVLGAFCLGILLRTGFKPRLLVATIPFSLFWFSSQVALLVCFGSVGPVYGNVLSALRGLFSVIFGAIVVSWGWMPGEARVSKQMWARRTFAATLVVAGIVLYSLYA